MSWARDSLNLILNAATDIVGIEGVEIGHVAASSRESYALFRTQFMLHSRPGRLADACAFVRKFRQIRTTERTLAMSRSGAIDDAGEASARERVDHGHVETRKVPNVASHDGESMHQSGGRYRCVFVHGARLPVHELRPLPERCAVHR